MAKNNKLTVESFVDKLVELKINGKTDKELALFMIKHPIFIAKNQEAITAEILKRQAIEQANNN